MALGILARERSKRGSLEIVNRREISAHDDREGLDLHHPER